MKRLRQARELVREHIETLPRPISSTLMAINRRPFAFGRAYASYRRRLREHEQGYDNSGDLLRAVHRAIATVRYYRERYRNVEIRSLDEFRQKVGFIDRATVATHGSALVSDAIDRDDYELCTTGGTSGPPLQLLAPKQRYVVELATMHSLWARAGYDFDVRAVIRNKRIPNGQLYVVNPITREVIFDGFRIDEENLTAALHEIARRRIRFIHCYPSAAFELARVMNKLRWPAKDITFLSGSEGIFAYQRDLIEGQVGARLYSWYGHTEKLVLAGHCATSRDYHVEPTYGYFELISDDGKVVEEPGGVGEIVGTAFHNDGMPLIRYRTGDRAELVGHQCAACGRRVPIIRNVVGRWNGERIYTSPGRFVTTTALNLHDEVLSVLDGLQYVQERIGELTVLVVRSSRYTDQDEHRLRALLSTKLDGLEKLEIKYVDQLLRHPNGKFTHLVSKVRA